MFTFLRMPSKKESPLKFIVFETIRKKGGGGNKQTLLNADGSIWL